MRRLRLRTLLAILVLVTTLPVAAFASWLVSRWSAQQQALIDRQNVEQARAILVAVDKEIESTIASLNVLALMDAIDAADKTDFIEFASRILALHQGWLSVRLIDNSLAVIASTSTVQGGSPVLDPQWARQIIQSERPGISKVVLDPARRLWVVSIGVPVRHPGRPTYVLGAKVDARMFNDVLQRQRVPLDGVVTLLDSTPRIVARTRNQDRYIGQSPTPDFVQRARSAKEGTWRTVLLEGTPAYSAWSRSDETGFTVGIGLPSVPVDQPLRRSFIAVVTGGAAVFGVGLVLALILGRRLVATQTAAAAAARSLAQGHPVAAFDSRITEAHDLAEGLREAAVILESRLRERDEAQAEADRHRAALLEQEQAARRAAESLNRAKDEFVATVSHELRTPLNVIVGWVAMLRSGALDDAKRAHALEVIERNTRLQVRLIEDLLDMSRAIQGTVRLTLEDVDVAALMESAIESLRPTAEARRITITAHARRGVALAHADPVRFQQVLWNVLSNALKFTPPGGRVTAEVAVENTEAVVKVTDTGEGIAPDFLPYVFDRFRQEDAEVTRSHPGLGLGLSLVRHLTELHGGTITATSDGKGKGSTFTIRLPLLQAASPSQQVRIS
jgi:signal transduction histidine kinase